ncbi:uncharacterized protein F5147DRAFT_585027, partial [Suillus discolor]
GILHRDCSLNNSMIEDDGNRSHGTLIDWEFAVFIAQGQKYARGGTVSLIFSKACIHLLISTIRAQCLSCRDHSCSSSQRLLIASQHLNAA